MIQRKLVLIVENDLDTRDAIATILQDEGYGVQEARDGAEALQQVAQGVQPALLLVDWWMACNETDESIEQLVHDEKSAAIPLLLMSTRDIPRVVRNGNGRPVRLLKKPFGLTTLLEEVEASLAC